MVRNVFPMIYMVCFSALTLPAYAQTITGRIVDISKNPMAGVRTILSQSQLMDTTGADGIFELKFATAIRNSTGTASPNFKIQANNLRLDLPTPQSIALSIISTNGKQVAMLPKQYLQAGSHSIPLHSLTRNLESGFYLLRLYAQHNASFLKIIVSEGRITSTSFHSLSAENTVFSEAAPAATDTLALTKPGYFPKKVVLTALNSQNLGDYVITLDPIYTRTSIYDQYDQILVESNAKYMTEPANAMVLKAMIVIESNFNSKAISMWDTQLPCGTHSYGLIQVTPGCIGGYASLPGGTAVTATISGGLNGNAAVLTYMNPDDKTLGNTVVRENNIVIDLVSNPSNPLWPTSAFNPAYCLDFGAKTLGNVLAEMKASFRGCSQANYMSMALAGYNQGSNVVSSCTSYGAAGSTYATNVINRYRQFCTAGGITPIY